MFGNILGMKWSLYMVMLVCLFQTVCLQGHHSHHPRVTHPDGSKEEHSLTVNKTRNLKPITPDPLDGDLEEEEEDEGDQETTIEPTPKSYRQLTGNKTTTPSPGPGPNPEPDNKTNKKKEGGSSTTVIVIILVVVVVLIGAGVGGYFGYQYWKKKQAAAEGS
ncbi:uncharacterized protein LOC103510271 [Diaphorina citri]|uniref:Uncharacterized protein LOC103510271 n=1 Tax=Diaphorina citri TaxID=121845 RepID=A0A1S3D2N9_DIACI|nr:uncharacterized protein LOC103510271 [Diaphorina citri]